MFYYFIKFLDSEDYKEVKESGLISATGYDIAMKKLCEYYGSDIIQVKLFALEDILSEEEIMNIFEEEESK